MKSSIRIYSRRTSLTVSAAVLFIATFAIQASFAQMGANDPITGVGVGLGKKPEPSADIVYKTMTDSTGGFNFTNVAPGEYVLVMLPPTPTPTRPTNPLPQAYRADSNSGPHVLKVQAAASIQNTRKSNVRQAGLVALNPSHVTFTGTKGAIIFVGGKRATGTIALSDANPVSIQVSSSASISGTIGN